jgi:hypothetical protein
MFVANQHSHRLIETLLQKLNSPHGAKQQKQRLIGLVEMVPFGDGQAMEVR